MKSMWRNAVGLVAAMAVLAALSAFSQQSAKKSAATGESGSKAVVQQITLPNITDELISGPNLQTYQDRCLLCHSNRYVAMQPRFPRAVWEKEVKKMVDVYGAPIPPAEQQEIVEYLVAVKGPVEVK